MRPRVARRASRPVSSVAFTPSAVSGLFAWYDASVLASLFQDSAGTTPVAANDDPVGKIADQGPNGYHMTQGTANARPLYKTSGLNSRKSINFDGSNDFIKTASVVKRDFTLFFVGEVTSATGYVFEHSASSSSETYLWKPTGDTAHINLGSANNGFDVTNYWAASANVYTQRYNATGTNHQVWRNGGSVLGSATTNPGTGNITAVMSVGAHNTGSSPAAMKLQELIIYNVAISDANKALVEAYLKAKWGTP